MLQTVPLPIIRRFSLYTIMVCVTQLASRIGTCVLILLASGQQTCMTYTIDVYKENS